MVKLTRRPELIVTTTPTSRLPLQLLVIAASLFVVWTGFGAILPYLPVFLQEEGHASVALIGLVAAAYYVGVVGFSSLFGLASDRFGRKPLLILGACLYLTATLLFITTTRPGWFVLFRFLEGMGAAAIYPAGIGFIADITDQSNRSRAFGWLTTAQFAGLVLGPALAVPLYQLGGGQGKWAFYSIFLFGSALTAVVVVAMAAVLREPVRTVRHPAREIQARPSFRVLAGRPVLYFLVLAASFNFASGAFEVIWSLWLRHLGASMAFVGATWVAFSLPMLLAFVGGRLADRYSRFWLVFIGFGLSTLCWMAYGTLDVLPLLLVFNVVEGLCVALSFPAKTAFLVQVAPPPWIGAVQGMEHASGQLAALVGTLVAPLVYQHVGGRVLAYAGSIALVGLLAVSPGLYGTWRSATREHAMAAAETDGAPASVELVEGEG
ncbi:MAG: MFS transporter [Gaiellales bacterium]|nr:MFS transporter [Gaiellales bacterium]